jgi:hypothetical protein
VTTLPDSLVRFGGELERAIARELGAERLARRRRTATRFGIALAAAGAIGLGVVSLPSDEGPVSGRVVDLASASERAAAVLVPASGSIVHEVAVHRQLHSDGTVSHWREESWRETSPPYRRRQVTTRSDGTWVETAAIGSEAAHLYDPASDTIYTTPPDSGPALGTPAPAVEGDPLQAQIVELLRSPGARELTRRKVDGHDSIRFVFRNRTPEGGFVVWTYLIDASSFRPLRMVVEAPGGSRSTIRFEMYEVTKEHDDGQRLLSLRAAHPSASVDATEAGYEAARARLYARP